MPILHMDTIVDRSQAIAIIKNALNSVDERLISHGDRVAYIACAIAKHPSLKGMFHLDTLTLLCIFHDIGAYKTEDVSEMLTFESMNAHAHAVYGYLFLKYFSPLADYAEAILYHHSPLHLVQPQRPQVAPYACLLHLADRIDILLSAKKPDTAALFASLERPTLGIDPSLLAAFRDVYAECDLFSILKTDLTPALGLAHNRVVNQEHIERLVEMIVYTIDFHSETTVVHAITTTWIAYEIAQFMGLSTRQCDEVYVGALLHDIGKISVPVGILEFNGPLNRVQMEVMKRHVNYSEDIIRGNIAENVCRIAIRHHEKLDGSGYPYGILGADLTQQERIVAVSDIVSALQGKRSYKDAYSNETTLGILTQLEKDGKLDSHIVKTVIDNFDFIMGQVNKHIAPILEKYTNMAKEYPPCLAALESSLPYRGI